MRGKGRKGGEGNGGNRREVYGMEEEGKNEETRKRVGKG